MRCCKLLYVSTRVTNIYSYGPKVTISNPSVLKQSIGKCNSYFISITEQKSRKLDYNSKESLLKVEVNAFTLAQLMYYGRLGKTKDYVVFKEVYHRGMSTRFVDTSQSIFETHGHI
jgi:hypothetical protein